MPDGFTHPGLRTSTGAHIWWPSSASVAWPRANVGSSATDAATGDGPGPQPEQVADPAVVRGTASRLEVSW